MRRRKWFKSHELEPEDGTVTKVRCVRLIFAGVKKHALDWKPITTICGTHLDEIFPESRNNGCQDLFGRGNLSPTDAGIDVWDSLLDVIILFQKQIREVFYGFLGNGD